MEHDTSEEEVDPEHDETVSLLTRKFSRFLRKKNRDRTQQRKRYSKQPIDSNSSNYTCFGCGKPGHIKADCPNNQNKEKSASKKSDKGKGRRHTSHGKKMMYPHLVIPQLKVKKQIRASW